MQVKEYLKKFKRIILSRFKTPPEEKIFNHRLSVCKSCPYNTKNMQKVSLKVTIIQLLSNFYTFVVNKKVEDLGNCSACGGCDVYYKCLDALDKNECPKNKWKL